MSETVANKIDADGLCEALRRAMLEAGIFPVAGIRVRAYRAEACAIADKHPENGFVAMTLVVGHGRSKKVLAQAGEIVFAAATLGLSAGWRRHILGFRSKFEKSIKI